MSKIAGEAVSTKNDKVRNAKRAFILSFLDLSWRLLGAMLLPIFVGLYIDSLRGGQTFALIGFVLGMVAGIFVMKDVIKKIARNAGNI